MGTWVSSSVSHTLSISPLATSPRILAACLFRREAIDILNYWRDMRATLIDLMTRLIHHFKMWRHAMQNCPRVKSRCLFTTLFTASFHGFFHPDARERSFRLPWSLIADRYRRRLTSCLVRATLLRYVAWNVIFFSVEKKPLQYDWHDIVTMLKFFVFLRDVRI